MTSILILVVMLLMPFHSGTVTNMIRGNKTGYDLSSPDKRLILPDILKEVSGITILDSVTAACIQDENGFIFIIDIRENRIKNQIIFGSNGDYEDITLVNKTMYVLRSDGTLFEISDFLSKGYKVTVYRTGVPSGDNEGMCYDRINNRLLIGCKGDIKKEDFKNKRAIFSFDLKSKKLLPEPVFVIDTKSVNRSINDNKGSSKDGKGKKEDVEIRISAIGLHPKTGKLFLLSAADHLLCILNDAGSIEIIENLDKDLFRQAEGIAFFQNGDMLITNEARDKKPTLLRFNYLFSMPN
jgi:hypothetical protein